MSDLLPVASEAKPMLRPNKAFVELLDRIVLLKNSIIKNLGSSVICHARAEFFELEQIGELLSGASVGTLPIGNVSFDLFHPFI